MDRKGYRTTRSFLSTFVLCQIVCCALTFSPCVESSSRMIGADSAILTEGLIAPELDARLNVAFSEAYEPMNLAAAFSDASVVSQLTPDLVIRMFPAAPRANVKKHLPLVRRERACRQDDDLDGACDCARGVRHFRSGQRGPVAAQHESARSALQQI